MTTNLNALVSERDRLDAEIAGMELDPKAAKAVAEAEAAIAAHDAKVAGLKAKRDALDERFGISAQREKEARRQARKERIDAQCQEMAEREESRLDHIQAAERHIEQAVANLSAAFADHTRLRELANTLAEGARLSSISALSPTEFESRTAAWICGLLQLVENLPGGRAKGRVGRIGEMRLATSPKYRPDLGWRAVEAREVAPAIEAVVGYAQGETD
jgi:seryl-tRNA synthetase